MWNICVESTHWKITDWKKPKTRYNGVVRETNWKGGKMFRKIVDWANTDSGKEVLTGVFWGFVGIIAVRIFCFLVCLATGYPIS